MSGETEPTPWELHRADKQILDSLRSIGDRMLTTERFEEYARGIGHRVGEVEARQTIADSASTAAHETLARKIEESEARTNVKLETQATRAEAIGTESRASKNRMWLAIGMVVLAALLSFAAALILQGTGTP